MWGVLNGMMMPTGPPATREEGQSRAIGKDNLPDNRVVSERHLRHLPRVRRRIGDGMPAKTGAVAPSYTRTDHTLELSSPTATNEREKRGEHRRETKHVIRTR